MKKLVWLLLLMIAVLPYFMAYAADGQNEEYSYTVREWLDENNCIVGDTFEDKFILVRNTQTRKYGIIEFDDSVLMSYVSPEYEQISHVEGENDIFYVSTYKWSGLVGFGKQKFYPCKKISSYYNLYLAGKNDTVSLYYNGKDLLKYNGESVEMLTGFGCPEYMWQSVPDSINIAYGEYYAVFPINDLPRLNRVGGAYPEYRNSRYEDCIIRGFINDSILYVDEGNELRVLVMRDTLELLADSCQHVYKGFNNDSNRFFSYISYKHSVDDSEHIGQNLFVHDCRIGKSYGPFYGSFADFLGYDRDSVAVFSMENRGLINLKGQYIIIRDGFVDTGKSLSDRGICISNGIATAYVRPEKLKWGKDILLNLNDWGNIEYEPYMEDAIKVTKITLAIPNFEDNPLLRQNMLYWFSEAVAYEAGNYMDYYNGSKDITFIPGLNTTSQEICDYYGDLLINLFDNSEDTESEEESGVYFGGHFTAGIKILSETDSLITAEIVCDSNLGGGSGFGSNIHPIATFDKNTGKRLVLPDIFDFGQRSKIAKIIDRHLHDYSSGWALPELSYAEILSMPFGVCSDSLKFIVSRHTFIALGGEFTIPLDEFGDALIKGKDWYKTEVNPQTAEIKYVRATTIKNLYDLESESNTSKIFPTKKFLKKHPFRKQKSDMSVIKAAKTINCGNNRVLGEFYLQNGVQGKAEEIFDELALAGYNGPMNSSSEELQKLLDLKLGNASDLLDADNNDSAEVKVRQFLWLAQDSTLTYRNGKLAIADGMILYSRIAEKKGDRATSVTMARNAARILLPYILNNSVRLSVSRRKELWDYYKNWCINSLPLLAVQTGDSALSRMSYDAVLNGKGLLLNTENAVRRAIEDSNDDYIKLQLKELDLMTAEYEALIQKGPQQQNNPELGLHFLRMFRTQKDSLNAEIGERREYLANRSYEYSRYLRGYLATSRQVCENLLEGEVAVEFIAAEIDNDILYYALVMHKGNPIPDIVKLCTQEEIIDVDFIGSGAESALTDGTVYKLIWEPLKKVLSENETSIYFSPDGALYTLPVEYAALPPEKPVMDFHRLSSTREIVFRNDSTVNKKGDAVIFGGLDYNNCQPQGNETEIFGRTRGFLRNYMLNKRSGITPLPATMEEVREIKASLDHMEEINKVISYTGAYGSEAAFKSNVTAASKIIHVATHGFYLSEDEFIEFSNTDIFKSLSKNYNDLEDKELYRSALLFAGINEIFSGTDMDSQGGEDGILTAKEISMLNMSGVDLAVLSACQSGLGDISSEGVAGLQRGLKKAGAHTILATLWKVDDEATKLLMAEFYRNLSSGQSQSESLNQARKFLKEYDNGKYSSPFYWAPFILIDAI